MDIVRNITIFIGFRGILNKVRSNTFATSKGKVPTWLLIILAAVLLVIAASGFAWWKFSEQPSRKPYDVIVVGAGPGGIAASLQAARMGQHVALIEQTDWVGGQMTAAGVGNMDEGSPKARDSGIYKEFLGKAADFYSKHNKSMGTCYYNIDSRCIDPQTGRTLLTSMVKSQKNLKLVTGATVTSVTKSGNTVTGVNVGSKHFMGKVIIDADEYGDVLDMAGARYRIGNTTSDEPSTKPCIQNITYTAVMKKYSHGVPTNLQFQSPPPGYNKDVAAHFATYLKQGGYDLKQKPNSTQASNRLPMSLTAFAAYRGFPDLANPSNYNAFQQDGNVITRTSLNLGNDYPLNGTLSSKYITDRNYRAKTDCRAKLLTLQLAYYIQHDLGQSDWSVADDEGYGTHFAQQHRCAELKNYEAFETNMSQEAYVREGRRVVGDETLAGRDMVASWDRKKYYTHYQDSIAVGYYPMDLHQCKTDDTLEPAFDDVADVARGGPFEVPMGVLVPQGVDGLLAAEKNISVSRLANGSIREQPISMNIGQAAGALAAIAAQHNEQPRYVLASDVQQALSRAGVVTQLQ